MVTSGDEMRSRSEGRRGLNSISNKLLVALVAVAVLPTVAVSIYALRRGTEALSDLELSEAAESTSRDARVLYNDLDLVFREAQKLADHIWLRRACVAAQRTGGQPARALTEEERHRFKQNFWSAREDLRRFVSKLDAVESVLVVAARPGTSGTRALLRAERVEGAFEIRELVTVHPGGYLLPAPDRERPEDAALKRDLGREVLEHPHLDSHRATVVTEGETFEAFMVTITSPPTSGDGGTRRPAIGRIIVSVSWRRLLEARCRTSETETSSGQRVGALLDQDLRPISQSAAGYPIEIPEVMEEAARAGRSGAHQSPHGELISFAPIVPPLASPHEFAVLAFQRPSSREAISHFRFVFAGVLSSALVFALLLGTYLSRRMTRPLRDLRKGASRLGAGELRHRIEVVTHDEVAEVADAFNTMAGELHSLYDGMEQTIRERTVQLQEALDELRGTHRELVESEARYSEIVESASDLIQVTDAEGRILRANRREAELLGCKVEDLVGTDFFHWLNEEVREPTRAAFQSVLEGATLRSHPSSLTLADGRRVPIEISATPILRHGECHGVRAIMRDISERKEMEAQLIRAERLSSVGALAAGVAHEINNPLGIITMFAQRAVERGRQGEVDVAKLEKIVEQARRVAQITRGLLDFSRAGPTAFEPVSVSACVQETAELVAERARRAEIDIQFELGEVPSVRGNAQQVSQVVLNLLLNAFDAIGSNGTVHLRVELADPGRLANDTPSVRVTVEDDGPGIPEDVLPHLFEPFFTTKGPSEGTGLGLSVSYGILKEHHGILTAGNRDEGGARFEFELPVRKPELPAAKA